MVEENSGKIFRFKLEFDLGYGFAEAYDFSDTNPFDGNLVFVYGRVDTKIEKKYNSYEITSSGISLGPIRLSSFPNSRGLHAWKFLFKHDQFIIEELNITKDAQDQNPYTHDWNELKRWHKSDWHKTPDYVTYDKVRHLETRIINTHTGVAQKATMKKIIDDGLNIVDYYDLSDWGNRNMFVQLINTYYPLKKTKELLKLIIDDEDNIA